MLGKSKIYAFKGFVALATFPTALFAFCIIFAFCALGCNHAQDSPTSTNFDVVLPGSLKPFASELDKDETKQFKTVFTYTDKAQGMGTKIAIVWKGSEIFIAPAPAPTPLPIGITTVRDDTNKLTTYTINLRKLIQNLKETNDLYISSHKTGIANSNVSFITFKRFKGTGTKPGFFHPDLKNLAEIELDIINDTQYKSTTIVRLKEKDSSGEDATDFYTIVGPPGFQAP